MPTNTINTIMVTKRASSTKRLAVLSLALFAVIFFAFSSSLAQEKSSNGPTIQPSSNQQPAGQQSSDPQSADTQSADQKSADQKTFGGELAHETRQAGEGQGPGQEQEEEQEENVKLKHSSPVRWLATKTNLSVHGAHLLANAFNFVVIAAVVLWAGFKFLPGMFRDRTSAIQKALEEARAASQDANRRLADIENRLSNLDSEIGKMQATAEKDAGAEEARIQQAAEEEMRKVVQTAEQEIAAAAKQARRDLSNHTAGLAIALASKQINVDANTDQALVRSFVSKLAANPADKPASNGSPGKDGQ